MSNISSDHEGNKHFHMVLKRRYPLRYRYRDFRQNISDRINTYKEEHPVAYACIDGALALIGFVIIMVMFTLLMVGLNPLDKPGFNV